MYDQWMIQNMLYAIRVSKTVSALVLQRHPSPNHFFPFLRFTGKAKILFFPLVRNHIFCERQKALCCFTASFPFLVCFSSWQGAILLPHWSDGHKDVLTLLCSIYIREGGHQCRCFLKRIRLILPGITVRGRFCACSHSC